MNSNESASASASVLWCDDCDKSASRGRDHNGNCDAYDGAPDERWKVTTPDEVYLTDTDLDRYEREMYR